MMQGLGRVIVAPPAPVSVPIDVLAPSAAKLGEAAPPADPPSAPDKKDGDK